MPRVSHEKQVAHQLALSQEHAFTAKHIAKLIGSATRNKVNLVRHYLFDFWKKGIVVRSQQEISLEYYYAAGTERTISIHGKPVSFIAYSPEQDSSQVKRRIIGAIQEHGLVSVRELCAILRPDFDIVFLRKINFHVQNLVQSHSIYRFGTRPFYYSVTLDDAAKVQKKSCSLSGHILGVFRQKVALRQHEVLAVLTNRKVLCTPVGVSTALTRLNLAGHIVRSEHRAGSRTKSAGFLYASSRTLLRISESNERSANSQNKMVDHNG